MAERGARTPELPLIRPDWAAPPAVRVACTTRAGGIGKAPYDTLNLGLHVGDREAAVRENRRRLARALALPAAPLWLRQVHGTDIVDLDTAPVDATLLGAAVTRGTFASGGDDDGGAGASTGVGAGGRGGSVSVVGAAARGAPLADGATTARPERVLAVLTADCLPLVLSDAAATRITVVHAGWRGLAGGIVRRAIETFPEEAALHAWLGPAIGPDAFEVGEEVRAVFLERDARHEGAFRPGAAAGKQLADLYRLARGEIAAVRRAGTVTVTGGDHCTLGEASRFFSHRRDGARTGRMATLAWIGSVGP